MSGTTRKLAIGGLILLSAGLLVGAAWVISAVQGRAVGPCIVNCGTSGLPNSPSPGSLIGTPPTSGAVGSQRDARFGVIATGDIDHALKVLGVQWWYSFNPSATANTGSRVLLVAMRANHGQIIRDPASRIQTTAHANPGSYWIIGNEPNIPGQDDLTPEQYADELQYYASTIRSVDPTARIVGPNVLNFDTTCSGCEGVMSGRTWIKRFIAAWSKKTGGDLPFDAWGIHVYSITWNELPMINADTTQREIASYSDFLSTLPTERSKPIWLTEFGVIWGYPGLENQDTGCQNGSDCSRPTGLFATQAIKSYLNQLLSWLSSSTDRYRVRKWFIYTTYGSAEPYATSYAGISLLNGPNQDGTLTTFGSIYRSFAIAAR